MCILFVHVHPEPKKGDYRLIVASNRDEYYDRPAATAKMFETNVIAGQDLQHGVKGGMWLGIGTKNQNNIKNICFAAILNLTGDHVPNASGRGAIVHDYLKSNQHFFEYVKQLDEKKFSGYNFVTVELSTEGTNIYHHSNIPVITSVYPGQHTIGFGNSPIFVPYAKVTAGRYQFQEIVDKKLKGEELTMELLNLLKDPTSYLPDKELEQRSPTAHKYLSSIFVKVNPPIYGTRTHSIVLVDYDWNIQFTEHSMEEPIDGQQPKWTINKILSKL